MTTTLYRAASRATIAPATFGRGACFASVRAEAEAYTRNCGFGGPALFAFTADSEYTLRVQGRWALTDLAVALWDEMAEWAEEHDIEDAQDLARWWQDRGYLAIFHVLENAPRVSEVVAEMYDWLVYDEPSVAGIADTETKCETWRYYGDRPMVGSLTA